MDAAGWDARYAELELVSTVAPNRFLVEIADDLMPGRALDLAAGAGRNAVWLARQGWEVTAVDFSGEGLRRAEALAAHHGVKIATVRADLIEYSPPAQAFDLVALAYLQVPEHWQARVITAAATAVAPAGTLLVVAHDRANLERGYGGPSRLEVLTTVDLVTAAITGLEIMRAEIAERPVDTPEGERIALDTLVVARRSA
jgi:2-polyprenyl-3-methyl-5-hydroxy-6-metoxy-1,4-benzoquinol methylase